MVKDYVRERRRRTREMFVPLFHPPGQAQCDFGEALVVTGGAQRKDHCFVLDLPHSDGCFVKAYPAESTEAFLDGHVSAYSFLGGIPQSILYDNTRLAVSRILGDGKRQRTRAFTELQSHYLFEDRFGRPGKGRVEGLAGYARRNFLVPVPSFESFDALNVYLERRCLEWMDATIRGHSETIGQRMERDLEALLPLPAAPYDACEKQAGRVSSLSRTGAELLFEVFSQHYERGSILVTTSLPFDEWTGVFGSERLTGALLDRLTHHVHILEMNGESYRLKHSRESTASPASEEPDGA